MAFELVSGVPLLWVRNSLKDYGLKISALQSHEGWATIPASLQGGWVGLFWSQLLDGDDCAVRRDHSELDCGIPKIVWSLI